MTVTNLLIHFQNSGTKIVYINLNFTAALIY
jgi:hypothetical protein